uniref:Uncharacterized protein n=1 Tax=Human herpesvirus 1 TaxID=10298 RepID=A0A2U9AAG5_HHV1|nr:hypothetical protein [Human alphaherpesvirus 1]
MRGGGKGACACACPGAGIGERDAALLHKAQKRLGKCRPSRKRPGGPQWLPPPTSRKRSTQRSPPVAPTSRKRSTQRSPPVASTRTFLLREGTNAGEPPPPPPRPPSSAPASPLLRPRVPPPPPPRPPSSAPASPPPPPTQGAYPCKKADRWVSVVGGPRGASPVFRGWGGWVFPRVPFRCDPDPEPGRRDADAVRSDGPLRVPLPVRVLRSRSRRSWPAPSAGVGRAGPLCAPERPAPRRPGPPPGPARSRARRQCSHFALIIYIYWDEVRTLRVLTSFTRRPRPLGAVPPAGQWGGGKAGGPWAARRPVGPNVRRAGPGARGRPTGARGSYLITAEPGSRGPGPAPGPFLVSMRNGSGNHRIGR